jgi:hypothetical protein
MCTLLNDRNEKLCSACGSVNILIEWSCSYCTLHNITQYERCVACGKMRNEPNEIMRDGKKELEQQSTQTDETKNDPLQHYDEPNFLLLPSSAYHQRSTHDNSNLNNATSSRKIISEDITDNPVDSRGNMYI